MRVVSLVVALFFVVAGTAIELEFEHLGYRVEKVGRKYFVYQPTFQLAFHDISTLGKNDCTLLSIEIGTREKSYYICDENPESPTCQFMKLDTIFRSKEENYQQPIILYPANRVWVLEYKDETIDETVLKKHVATKLNINEEDAIVKPNQEAIIDEFPAQHYSAESLTSKVTKIVPLAPGFLEPLSMVKQKIVTNNRFLACDLETGKLNIIGKAVQNLSYTESISEDNLDAIWSVYSELRTLVETERFRAMPNIIQAAHLGKKLELSIRGHGLQEANRFEELLEELFSIDQTLSLKNFETKKELREQQYPTRTFSKTVEVTWSLQ